MTNTVHKEQRQAISGLLSAIWLEAKALIGKYKTINLAGWSTIQKIAFGIGIVCADMVIFYVVIFKLLPRFWLLPHYIQAPCVIAGLCWIAYDITHKKS